MMTMTHKPLARALAVAGFTLAVALTAAAPGRAEVVCDTDKAEDGRCDPGAAAAKTAAEGSAGTGAMADDLPVEAIRKIIRDYLIEHPEVLIEAQQALRAKRAEQEAAQARRAVHELRDALLSDPEAPVAGNPDGAVTLVEFFDYRCGYCRRVKPTLETLIAENDDLRLVYKEFPILGPESDLAARAALAARAQGLYGPLHAALMDADSEFDLAGILEIARSVGLDPARLESDMDDPAFDELIARNGALAQALGIRGTPGFVIGERVIGGMLPLDEFRAVIADARQALQQGSGAPAE